MPQPHRNTGEMLSGGYRYSFQGQESDDEIKGEGNSINYIYRMHDPRVGRFFAVDPLARKFPHWTPYSFSGNQVIHTVELEGLENGYNLNYNEGTVEIRRATSGPFQGEMVVTKAQLEQINNYSGGGSSYTEGTQSVWDHNMSSLSDNTENFIAVTCTDCHDPIMEYDQDYNANYVPVGTTVYIKLPTAPVVAAIYEDCQYDVMVDPGAPGVDPVPGTNPSTIVTPIGASLTGPPRGNSLTIGTTSFSMSATALQNSFTPTVPGGYLQITGGLILVPSSSDVTLVNQAIASGQTFGINGTITVQPGGVAGRITVSAIGQEMVKRTVPGTPAINGVDPIQPTIEKVIKQEQIGVKIKPPVEVL